MKVEVHGCPPIGSLLIIDLQEYRLLRLEDYLRRDGVTTKLCIWATSCPKCGDPFEATSVGITKAPTRRCETCRKVTGISKVLPGRKALTAILELSGAALHSVGGEPA